MDDGLKPCFVMFARYNQWANERLFEAVAMLSEAEYRRDGGAFFKSLHGTLNHLLVADRIWLRRLTGSGDAPARLDTILFERLADLRAARRAEDQRLISWIEQLEPSAFEGSVRYSRASSSEIFEQKIAPALFHVFNHQTHHRGQAHALLTATAGTAPELDLVYFQRLSEKQSPE